MSDAAGSPSALRAAAELHLAARGAEAESSARVLAAEWVDAASAGPGADRALVFYAREYLVALVASRLYPDAAGGRYARQLTEARAALAEYVAHRPAAPEFVRASGDCFCARCGLSYYRHPHDPHYLASDGAGGSYPWLRRLCDGTLVKL